MEARDASENLTAQSLNPPQQVRGPQEENTWGSDSQLLPSLWSRPQPRAPLGMAGRRKDERGPGTVVRVFSASDTELLETEKLLSGSGAHTLIASSHLTPLATGCLLPTVAT